MHANEMRELYDRHHELSPNLNSYKKTNNSVQQNDKMLCLSSGLGRFLDMGGTDWPLRPYAHMKEKRILSFTCLNKESKTEDVYTCSLA